MDDAAQDRISTDLASFFDGLSPDDRECLVDILREPKTFLAEDLTDVLAILRQLQSGDLSDGR